MAILRRADAEHELQTRNLGIRNNNSSQKNIYTSTYLPNSQYCSCCMIKHGILSGTFHALVLALDRFPQSLPLYPPAHLGIQFYLRTAHVTVPCPLHISSITHAIYPRMFGPIAPPLHTQQPTASRITIHQSTMATPPPPSRPIHRLPRSKSTCSSLLCSAMRVCMRTAALCGRTHQRLPNGVACSREERVANQMAEQGWALKRCGFAWWFRAR